MILDVIRLNIPKKEGDFRPQLLQPLQGVVGLASPAEDRQLIALAAQLDSGVLGGNPDGVVDIIDTIVEPDATGFGVLSRANQLGHLLRSGTLHAMSGNLPTGLIGNGPAVTQGQAFAVTQVANGTNIDFVVVNSHNKILQVLLWGSLVYIDILS